MGFEETFEEKTHSIYGCLAASLLVLAKLSDYG